MFGRTIAFYLMSRLDELTQSHQKYVQRALFDQAGFDVNQRDNFGRTIFEWNESRNNPLTQELFKHLIEPEIRRSLIQVPIVILGIVIFLVFVFAALLMIGISVKSYYYKPDRIPIRVPHPIVRPVPGTSDLQFSMQVPFSDNQIILINDRQAVNWEDKNLLPSNDSLSSGTTCVFAQSQRVCPKDSMFANPIFKYTKVDNILHMSWKVMIDQAMSNPFVKKTNLASGEIKFEFNWYLIYIDGRDVINEVVHFTQYGILRDAVDEHCMLTTLSSFTNGFACAISQSNITSVMQNITVGRNDAQVYPRLVTTSNGITQVFAEYVCPSLGLVDIEGEYCDEAIKEDRGWSCKLTEYMVHQVVLDPLSNHELVIHGFKLLHSQTRRHFEANKTQALISGDDFWVVWIAEELRNDDYMLTSQQLSFYHQGKYIIPDYTEYYNEVAKLPSDFDSSILKSDRLLLVVHAVHKCAKDLFGAQVMVKVDIRSKENHVADEGMQVSMYSHPFPVVVDALKAIVIIAVSLAGTTCFVAVGVIFALIRYKRYKQYHEL
jgi:hypothetical protein